MSLFNDNDIIQGTNDSMVNEWCKEFVVTFNEAAVISKTRKSKPNYILSYARKNSSKFTVENGVISFNEKHLLINNDFVINGYKGTELPSFISFEDTIGKLILINCPNLNKEHIPHHMYLMEFNDGEDDVNDVITKTKIVKYDI